MPSKIQPGRKQNTESVLVSWLGHRVVVKYVSGPDEPADPEDEKGLARGQTEARSGIFELHRVGDVGIEVANTLEDAASDRVTLIPWGAIPSIRGSTPQERGEADGRISKEALANLAYNDPT